jgi:hypothetical protein
MKLPIMQSLHSPVTSSPLARNIFPSNPTLEHPQPFTALHITSAEHRTTTNNWNLRLDLHMGFTTSYSIMKTTAHIITAASDAFGMK